MKKYLVTFIFLLILFFSFNIDSFAYGNMDPFSYLPSDSPMRDDYLYNRFIIYFPNDNNYYLFGTKSNVQLYITENGSVYVLNPELCSTTDIMQYSVLGNYHMRPSSLSSPLTNISGEYEFGGNLYGGTAIFRDSNGTVIYPNGYKTAEAWITLPNNNDYFTVSKDVTYWISYQLDDGNTFEDYKININNSDGSSLSSDGNVIGYEVIQHTYTASNNTGYMKLLVKYNRDFIGETGLNVQIEYIKNNENKILSNDTRIINIKNFVDVDNNGFDDVTGEEQYNSIVDSEVIVISKNLVNSNSSSKLLPLTFFVKIRADDWNYVDDHIQVLWKNPSTNIYENLLTSSVLDNWNASINNKNQIKLSGYYKSGDYIVLNYTLNLLFKEDFIGNVPLKITANSDIHNQTISETYIFNIIAFTDSNNDGIDDNTGQPYNPNPTLPDVSNNDFTLDNAIGMMTNWLSNSMSWLSNITSLIKILFSFLPLEVVGLITLLISIMVIFSIIKVIRG